MLNDIRLSDAIIAALRRGVRPAQMRGPMWVAMLRAYCLGRDDAARGVTEGIARFRDGRKRDGANP